jgi:hypothetical protein
MFVRYSRRAAVMVRSTIDGCQGQKPVSAAGRRARCSSSWVAPRWSHRVKMSLMRVSEPSPSPRVTDREPTSHQKPRPMPIRTRPIRARRVWAHGCAGVVRRSTGRIKRSSTAAVATVGKYEPKARMKRSKDGDGEYAIRRRRANERGSRKNLRGAVSCDAVSCDRLSKSRTELDAVSAPRLGFRVDSSELAWALRFRVVRSGPLPE